MFLATLLACTTSPTRTPANPQPPSAAPVEPVVVPPPRALVVPPPLSDALLAAYTAEAGGRLAEAAAGFAAAASDEPAHLAHLGDVYARLGDVAAAERQWAAARAALLGRGATLRIDVVHTRPAGVVWRGDELVTVASQRLSRWWTRDPDRVDPGAARMHLGARPLAFPGANEVVAFTADGRGFLHEEEGTLVERDLLTGAYGRPFARIGEYTRILLAVGAGDELRVFASGPSWAGLWDAGGQLQAGFLPDRTTATLEPWPATYATAAAMNRDATLVAIGTADGRLRLHDLRRGTATALGYAWDPIRAWQTPEDPHDLNPPRALGFDARERLVAVYAHGDILAWDPRSGSEQLHHPGRCTPVEAAAHARARGERASPRAAIDCGRVAVAGIAPGGATIAAADPGGALRVRSTATGRTLHHAPTPRPYSPWPAIAVATSGAAALVEHDGRLTTSSPGRRGAQEPTPREQLGGSPWLAPDGRLLHMRVGPPGGAARDIVWDLQTRKQLAVPHGTGAILAWSGDQRWLLVKHRQRLEIRAFATGERLSSLVLAPGQQLLAQFVANDGRAVLHLRDNPDQDHVAVLAADGGVRRLPGARLLAVSDDGRWLVTREGDRLAHLHELAGDALRSERLPDETRRAAFARDGSRLLTTSRIHFTERAQVRSLVGPRATHERTGPLLALAVAISPDGRDAWIYWGDRITRWRVDTGETADITTYPIAAIHTLSLAADGKTVRIVGDDFIDVWTAADMRRVGSLHALDSGGWVTMSRSGAVDGTDDAVDHLITRAYADDATLVFTGRLGWAGAHVPGAAAQVLAGADVNPPQLLRDPDLP